MATDLTTQVEPQRKRYRAPLLHVYGGIEALTKKVGGSSGNADGAGNNGSMSKTF